MRCFVVVFSGRGRGSCPLQNWVIFFMMSKWAAFTKDKGEPAMGMKILTGCCTHIIVVLEGLWLVPLIVVQLTQPGQHAGVWWHHTYQLQEPDTTHCKHTCQPQEPDTTHCKHTCQLQEPDTSQTHTCQLQEPDTTHHKHTPISCRNLTHHKHMPVSYRNLTHHKQYLSAAGTWHNTPPTICQELFWGDISRMEICQMLI